MARYAAPLADIRFALYDVLDVENLFKRLPGHETATRDVIDAVLEEAAKFTEQVLAPLNQSGDHEGCHFDAATASVTTPAGFKKAYEQYVENGWPGLTSPAEFGGQEMPQVLGAAVKEMLDSANLAWSNFPLLSHGATEALLRHGEEVARSESAAEFEFAVKERGAYRLEAWLKLDGELRPWIYSNPIYVK